MTNPTDQNPPQGDPPTAGSQNTGNNQTPPPDNKPPTTWEEVFEHPRFKQLVQRASDAETKVKQAEKDKKDAEDAEAKKRGEYEKLYNESQQAIAQQQGELRLLQIRDALRAYLDEKHPDYAGKAKWIVPFVKALDAKATEAQIAEAAKEAAEAWIKENPLQQQQPGQGGGPSNRGGSHSNPPQLNPQTILQNKAQTGRYGGI